MDNIAVRDLHMSHEWSVDRTDYCPCIASSSNLWARGPREPEKLGAQRLVMDRFLCGSELLMLQGLDYSRQRFRQSESLADTLKESDLVDLAGIAFNASVLYPLLTAVVSCAPLADAIALCKLSLAEAPVAQETAAPPKSANPMSEAMMDFDVGWDMGHYDMDCDGERFDEAEEGEEEAGEGDAVETEGAAGLGWPLDVSEKA